MVLKEECKSDISSTDSQKQEHLRIATCRYGYLVANVNNHALKKIEGIFFF